MGRALLAVASLAAAAVGVGVALWTEPENEPLVSPREGADLGALAAELPAELPTERTTERPADTSPGTDPGAASASGAPAPDGPAAADALALRAPAVPNRWAEVPEPPTPTGLQAAAFWFNAQVHARPRAGADVKGILRRGRALAVGDRVGSRGCSAGWYPVEGGGYVCNREGVVVSSDPAVEWSAHDTRRGLLPYAYAAVTRGAQRFSTLPDSASASAGETLDGDYFVTVVGERAVAGERFLETALGEWVRARDTSPAAVSGLAGELLAESGMSLPIAFVLDDDTPLVRVGERAVEVVGSAEQYARFHVEEELEREGVSYLVGEGGLGVRADAARVARGIERPLERIAVGERFIHVDLGTQTLVAYDADDTPVLATLVASGREGYETPAGTFRFHEKYVSIEMSGEDPVDGPYEVEEVPWTMYYFRSYALHGAYWHDAFGRPRSHGCTNLAPHDARWLFEWIDPELPAGWHGRRLRRGTWVHLTR